MLRLSKLSEIRALFSRILILFIFLCLLGCSDGESPLIQPKDVGSATFSIEWPDNASQKQVDTSPNASAITYVDCSTLGVSLITATFTDGSGTTIASGSWSCSAHTGRVDNIPTGTDRRIIIRAKDGVGNDLFVGEKLGIVINAGQTTSVGAVSLDPVGTEQAPDQMVGWYSGFGVNGVGIWGRPVTDAATYNLYISTDGGITYAKSDIQPMYTLENQNAFLFMTDISSNTYFRVTAVSSSQVESDYTTPLYVEYTNRASMPLVTVNSPANGSTGVSLTPTITWEPYTGSTIAGYIVQVRQPSSAFEIVVMKCPTTTTSWTLGATNDIVYNYVDTMSPSLQPNTQYACGIGAVDSSGSVIATSKTILFTTAASQ